MSDLLRVAVVGSGPAGIYAADALTSQSDVPVAVDVIDRLPAPYGLVRYGVAPDHLSIRSVRTTLEKVLGRDGVRFVGGVEVGRDVTLAQLRDNYDAVILAYGASRDRLLGVPGEELRGSIAATDLVNWYCGHPDAPGEVIEAVLAQAGSVVVVGVGNVAVDVVRVLAKTSAELDYTDMPQHVLDHLDRSKIHDIHLLGRRGPAQASFTTKELRELHGELLDADVVVDADDVALDEQSALVVASDKVAARNVEVVREWAQRSLLGRGRRIHVHFWTRPVAIEGDDRVTGVVVERTTLDAEGAVVGTGLVRTIEADTVIRSVGYRGTGLDGAPFDHSRHVVPNVDGRVVDEHGAVVPGLYVSGWIRRGPSGIIGTNKKDATGVVAALLADVADGAVTISGRHGVHGLLSERGVAVVDIHGWRGIDAAEIALGESRGRARTTIHHRDALFAAATPD